jgi:DNA-binding MarR family transcriptional regulator
MRLAQRLQDEGLLRRERDAEDTRVMRLHTTEEGRLLIENGQERRDGLEDRIRRELSEEELAEFKRLLGVVAQVMAN